MTDSGTGTKIERKRDKAKTEDTSTSPQTAKSSELPEKPNANSGSQLTRQPFTNAVLEVLRQRPELAKSAASALLTNAANGDLRAFTALREIVEGEGAALDDSNAKREDLNVIEVRILELLQKSPELLAKLDAMRNKPKPAGLLS